MQIAAKVDPAMHKLLTTYFYNENLFKRTSYAQGFPEGAPVPKPSLAPHLNNFIKNDACPEITVKSLLTGQMHQAATIWEMKAFEYVAERAFDGFLDIMETAAALGVETNYEPEGLDLKRLEIAVPAEAPPADLESEASADAEAPAVDAPPSAPGGRAAA